MKKLLSLLALAITANSFWSCTGDSTPNNEVQLPKVGISADAAFNNGTATLTLTLSEAATDAVTVPLEISSNSTSEGFTALTATNLNCDASATIEKGKKTATASVSVKDAESLAPGKYEAVIAIGNVSGATVNANASAAHIQLIVEEKQPEQPKTTWTERKDWAMNYDPTVNTGSDSKPFAIVVTACDAPYFIFTAAPAGSLEAYGIEAIATNAAKAYLDYVSSGQATAEQLAAAGYIYTPASLPLVAPSNEEKTPAGCELYLIGFDADFNLSGEWHMEINTYTAE